mmetsp:Transcript_111495/g.314808  ORF Transcript_111495/g.314808 Transcript_111495/m.314808 type:complete len:296 (-) Transcript_111495:21-908(-)|eukprot:CAMPEP_0117599864 /NCGR_PEP_ID=MMETSP0784-20121206/76175_1 /TAXON_ID=39447 /ORGANISM="" /LENGTH=295 /DNA_ID=CAMNT_0005402445 /DNA_START=40 /DNA_END=927 /DNA_ORIENTATION=+
MSRQQRSGERARTVDLLGESLTLPEDLSALLEDGGFPSRPTILPDELRGALLLPSESGSFSTRDDASFGSQGKHSIVGSAGLDALGNSRTELGVSTRGDESRNQAGECVVGLAACQHDASSSLTSSSKSNQSGRSKEWSLSDIDLRDLLEQDMVPDVSATGTNRDASVRSPQEQSLPATCVTSPAPSSSARSQGVKANSSPAWASGLQSEHVAPESTPEHVSEVASRSTPGSTPSQHSAYTIHSTDWAYAKRGAAMPSCPQPIKPNDVYASVSEDDILEIECLEASISSGKLPRS